METPRPLDAGSSVTVEAPSVLPDAAAEPAVALARAPTSRPDTDTCPEVAETAVDADIRTSVLDAPCRRPLLPAPRLVAVVAEASSCVGPPSVKRTANTTRETLIVGAEPAPRRLEALEARDTASPPDEGP